MSSLGVVVAWLRKYEAPKRQIKIELSAKSTSNNSERSIRVAAAASVAAFFKKNCEMSDEKKTAVFYSHVKADVSLFSLLFLLPPLLPFAELSEVGLGCGLTHPMQHPTFDTFRFPPDKILKKYLFPLFPIKYFQHIMYLVAYKE